MDLYFHPDNEEFIEAAKEYQLIWQEDGGRIVRALETTSKMKFKETFINAIIIERISHSHPLTFRASYPADIRKATIIHELAHRLYYGNGGQYINSLENHKRINHFLYESWVLLYGKEFADTMVRLESERAPIYKEAWEWTLSQKKEQ